MKNPLRFGVLGILLAGARIFGEPRDLTVVDLRCELDLNPLGVEVPRPQLGWVLQSGERGQTQTAYQVLAASTAALLARDQADLWNSGQIASDDPQGVLYDGRALTPSQQVFWKVRVWDRHGNPSPWSAAATWTMGLLEAGDWSARWITDPELLRWQRPLLGYHSEETNDPDTRKWVQLDLGAPQALDEVRLHALRHSCRCARAVRRPRYAHRRCSGRRRSAARDR